MYVFEFSKLGSGALRFPVTHKASFKSYLRTLVDGASCSLTISVGQPTHEGSKLHAVFAAANSMFSEMTIMVCDSLQRHSMASEAGAVSSDAGSEAFRDRAVAEGKEWKCRNSALIDSLNIPVRVVFWDEWLSSNKFSDLYAMLLEHHRNDHVFQKAMSSTIKGFYDRAFKRNPAISYESLYFHSFNYLIEECAVQLLWAELDINYEIYPCIRNEILSCCYNQFVAPKYPNRLLPVSIKFKRVAEYWEDLQEAI